MQTKVSLRVLIELGILRNAGVNMYEADDVVRCAEDMGCEKAAEWVRENRVKFLAGVLFGFVSDDSIRAVL